MRPYKTIAFMIACMVTLTPIICVASDQIPRTIIALWSQAVEEEIRRSPIHFMAEMPLNHLGLTVEYHNIDEGLPDIANRKDVRGILTWFQSGTVMKEPEAYLKWATDAVKKGKRYVLIEGPGFYENNKGAVTSNFAINKFFSKIGIRDEDDWLDYTYSSRLTMKDLDIVEYERPYRIVPPSYNRISPSKKGVVTHLLAEKRDEAGRASSLVITSPTGGYIAEGFAYFFHLEYQGDKAIEVRQWYINPFKFFRLSFGTDDLPKPDTTTMAGRRIYYSHIDGDGWNNVTHIEDYKQVKPISAEVIMERAIKKYQDLPVSVAPIAADIDKEWVATDKSIEVAKELLALPNVEAASHTYSHPFFWGFFEDENPDKEKPFLRYYPYGAWQKRKIYDIFVDLFRGTNLGKSDEEVAETEGAQGYDFHVPRGFANKKYSTELEIEGSIKAIEELLPKDKKVKILMWSGNTLPYAKAINLTRKAGIRNINGGDTRFDREYSSIGWVSPVGRTVNGERQIYASNSNENTYTDLWTGRYYGFKYLVRTIENTESPIRLKPFNVYYHMYSGERKASLKALLDNLDYARTQKITPITASHYAGIGDGFYTTNIIPLNDGRYKITNRDELQTIRFDRAVFKTADLEKSTGVIGWAHFQGSLYVYLDAEEKEPIIALKPHDNWYKESPAPKAYLDNARWPIWNVKHSNKTTTFNTQGFGQGEMRWIMPKNGNYNIKINGKPYVTLPTKNHILNLFLPQATYQLQKITIERVG